MLDLIRVLLILIFFVISFMSCASRSNNSSALAIKDSLNSTRSKMKIKIENSIFTATLYDNATATAFKSLLPITVNMIELKDNEKYIDLLRSLPENAFNPGAIQNGDLMLYGSSTLVLFYKTFSTSYSYTKLGRIDDVTELTAAVGTENVTVTYESQ